MGYHLTLVRMVILRKSTNGVPWWLSGLRIQVCHHCGSSYGNFDILGAQKKKKSINVGEGMEKREPSCTVAENVNWYSHYGE